MKTQVRTNQISYQHCSQSERSNSWVMKSLQKVCKASVHFVLNEVHRGFDRIADEARG